MHLSFSSLFTYYGIFRIECYNIIIEVSLIFINTQENEKVQDGKESNNYYGKLEKVMEKASLKTIMKTASAQHLVIPAFNIPYLP